MKINNELIKSIFISVVTPIILVSFLYIFSIRPFSTYVPNISVITWTGSTVNNTWLDIWKDCLYTSWVWYKSTDIANYDNIILTQKDVWPSLYTKKIYISWDVSDIYFCIISDVRSDYKAKNAYYFNTYVYFWNSDYRWHINVWFNADRLLTYDNSTDGASPFLNGKYYGSETPFSQIIDLKSVIIADTQNGWYKRISPIDIYKDWSTLSVWWYVNSYPNYWAGKIIMFRIIYKGWEISLVE
jgi:hypothetical protein